MALPPSVLGVRDVSDYLFAIDPSGQSLWGYCWDRSDGSRPQNIYDDVHNDPQGFIKSARVPIFRNPLHLSGPGYDIFGGSFGLVAANNHSVFKNNTPIIDWQATGDVSDYRVGPIDLRYDEARHVWTMPYTAFIAEIEEVAPIGSGYTLPNNTLVSTLPVKHYYSVSSGLYRYVAVPYLESIPEEEEPNYPEFLLNNVAEFNGDLPFLTVGDKVMVIKGFDIPDNGGLAYLCNERPISFAAFI